MMFLLLFFLATTRAFAQGESYYLMGTYTYIELGNRQLNDNVYRFLRLLEMKLSDYVDSSEISQVNYKAGKEFVRVSPQTLEVLKISLDVSEKTWGYFDVTIGALTINSKRLGKFPADSAIKLVNYKNLVIKDDSVMLKITGMAIDLGGIGKGYAIDKVFEEFKVKKGFISIGGDMKLCGIKKTLAIRDPLDGGVLAEMVNRKDVAISSSGNYIRKHIETSDSNIVQVTVAHERATYADAFATAIFAMPDSLKWKFVRENPDIGVLFLFSDGSVFFNKGFQNFFELIIFKNKKKMNK